MGLSFCSLSSGSSGNCYVVKTENTTLLIDAGISGKRIFDGLSALGIEDNTIKGVLITHEHIDHVKSVKLVSKKKAHVNIYASEGTWDTISDCVALEKQRTVFAGKAFTVGDITVKPFAISHDAAEPIGYSIYAQGGSISIVTDTGVVTEEIHNEIKKADILVLEANHDVHTLQFCRYPYNVKRRILGEFGHLSNDAAAEELCRIYTEPGCETKHRQVILAHLSKENNFPEMAYQTVRNTLEDSRIYIGRDLSLHIIERDKISPVFTID